MFTFLFYLLLLHYCILDYYTSSEANTSIACWLVVNGCKFLTLILTSRKREAASSAFPLHARNLQKARLGRHNAAISTLGEVSAAERGYKRRSCIIYAAAVVESTSAAPTD